MKKSGISIVALLQALALAALFAFAAGNAQAHTPQHSGANATYDTAFDGHQHAPDCTSFMGSEHRLHCHLTSTGAEATGPARLADEDQPHVFVPGPAPIARHAAIRSALAVTRIPIAGPPSYILFGNYRS